MEILISHMMNLYTAVAAAAATAVVGRGETQQAGLARAVHSASSHPPMCCATPGTVASFLLHYEQGIA